jgi:hypothetical protein
MNVQAQRGYENAGHRDETLTGHAKETATKYANKARDVGEEAIDRADQYLKPIGLSIRERPIATLAIFGGMAFAAGAFWKLCNSRQQSHLDGLLAQLPDLSHRSRWW